MKGIEIINDDLVEMELFPEQIRFLEASKKMARASQGEGLQVGCYIVNGDGKILAKNFSCPSHPVVEIEKIYCRNNYQHAEYQALQQLNKNDTNNSNLVIYCSWMPCIDCAILISKYAIKKLVTFSPPLSVLEQGYIFKGLLPYLKTYFDSAILVPINYWSLNRGLKRKK